VLSSLVTSLSSLTANAVVFRQVMVVYEDAIVNVVGIVVVFQSCLVVSSNVVVAT